MNEVFSVIAGAEISAQAVDFGPFDSVDTLHRLKEKLSALRMDKCLGIKKLIEFYYNISLDTLILNY